MTNRVIGGGLPFIGARPVQLGGHGGGRLPDDFAAIGQFGCQPT